MLSKQAIKQACMDKDTTVNPKAFLIIQFFNNQKHYHDINFMALLPIHSMLCRGLVMAWYMPRALVKQYKACHKHDTKLTF